MNKVVLIGRFTRDPEVRYTQGGSSVANFSLAVDRRFKQEGGDSADFIRCVSFGKTAEFIEKYFHKGMKIGICGRIQTGSYTNNEGQKVYTTDVVIEEAYFVESKSASNQESQHKPVPSEGMPNGDGFMNVPDGIDEVLPFNQIGGIT